MNNREWFFRALIPTAVVILGVVFWIDWRTPLGTAEWILYIAPVALCVFGQRAWWPLAVAGLATVLMVVGFHISPKGVDPGLAAINRLLGAATLWMIAIIAAVFIRARNQAQNLMWLQQGSADVGRELLGQTLPAQLADRALSVLVRYTGAHAGVIYEVQDEGELTRLAAWGQLGDAAPERLPSHLGGLPGQVARERRVIEIDRPREGLVIGSALAPAAPRRLIAAPITAEGAINAVIELGFSDAPVADVAELLRRCAEGIGTALQSVLYRQRLEDLLRQTQQQKEELQAQQEELQASNEELEQQSRMLRDSQARLELQQTELEQTNQRLEEESRRLEERQRALVEVRDRLAENGRALERANRYKSEFLANMSHELRTPLNSSLILAKLLADNKAGNLTAEQIRYAETIQSSNNELLALINDILDLSKIESGKVDMHPEAVDLDALIESLDRTFRAIAEQKHLVFSAVRDVSAPASIVTDNQRLQQILRNLLSNAIKFTATGSVRLRISGAANAVRIEVEDTGIGIPADQHEAIFEAFHQADGTTSRKYGGTGLGLSISRELARLLSGRIEVASAPGRGSRFILTLPSAIGDPVAATAPPPQPVAAPSAMPRPVSPELADDRRRRTRGDRVILIVEDDPAFSQILYDLVHDLDFDALRAATAGEALALAREFRPCAILLDAQLPDDSGLTVLDRLKRDTRVRHIPIHMVSAHDHIETAMQLGAVGYTLKPTTRDELEQAIRGIEARMRREVKRLLIVEDDSNLRGTMRLLLEDRQLEIDGVGTVAEARERLASVSYDCVVMDLMLPDGSGFELLESMAIGGRYAFPPVIVYTGRSIDAEEEQRLRKYSRSIIVKGARSPERLLDEVTLFLHSVETDLPPERQRTLRELRERDAIFEGRRVLIAEDDVRNIFALTQVLEPLGAKLEIARNGREALAALEANRPDLVLMDIMMPEMDGITAIRELRQKPQLSRLPVIALTAKAMPEDRHRCLEAGANDYIAKPIEVDKLLSLCRVWMPR